MKKSLCAVLAVAALSLAVANPAKGNPQFQNDSTIVCGSKKLVLDKSGDLILSNAAGEIVRAGIFYVFVEKASGNIDWITFTPQLCKVKREGNKVTWELWKKHKLHTWKLADQILELQPDGRIKVSVKLHLPQTDKLVPRGKNGAVFILFPLKGNSGKKFVFNGESMSLDEKMKGLSAWRGKYDFDMFPDTPDKKVLFSGSDIKDCSMYVSNNKYRITFVLKPDMSGSYFIDLR